MKKYSHPGLRSKFSVMIVWELFEAVVSGDIVLYSKITIELNLTLPKAEYDKLQNDALLEFCSI